MNSPMYCLSAPQNDSVIRAWFSWVYGRGSNPDTNFSFNYLLTHCSDGVTWGRWDVAKKCWHLGCNVFHNNCPQPQDHNILELRLFGPEQELFIWKTISGFSGRIVSDNYTGNKDPLAPCEEKRILRANRVLDDAKSGFTRVGDGTGAEQVVPFTLDKDIFGEENHYRYPLRLKVKHYFSEDDETGAVRVTVTRLVSVYLETDL
jgi:CRISPR-associated protein (TIGR03984 family)